MPQKKAKRTRKRKTVRKKVRKHHRKRTKTAKKVSKKELSGFCKKCGSLMIPVKKGRTTYMKCRSCGYSTRERIKNIKLSKEKEKRKRIIVVENDNAVLPTVEKICPNCEHKKAYWWMQQTRASDEPPTQFFKCLKCKHVWREYK